MDFSYTVIFLQYIKIETGCTSDTNVNCTSIKKSLDIKSIHKKKKTKTPVVFVPLLSK